MGKLDLFRDRETVDVALRLLDHQIVGEGGQLVGNADNLEVRESGEGLTVTALVVGPAGLGPRMPGRLGRWIVAVWRRMSLAGDPGPIVLPLSEVQCVGWGVEVSERGAATLANGAGLERWLRRHLVGRMPGAKEGEDRLAGEPLGEAAPSPGVEPGGHLISDLIGARVNGPGVEPLGRVLDVGCTAFERTDHGLGRLQVVDLLVGFRHTGARLGYVEDSHEGPWLIARLVRRLHRRDRRVPISAVESIDWDSSVITVSLAHEPGQE